MARRIRWQILIATLSSLLVLGLMGYLALTTTAVARPLAGGDYVEGVVATPQQLNPLISDPTRDAAGADIQALLFDGLMRTGADGLPEPALAQSWDVNDAGTVYTFTLRADITWHDGTPLTADDVLFTLRTVQGRGFAGDSAAGDIWRNVLIDQVGDRSVRCTLEAPFAPFLSRATFPILPAHLLRNIPPDQWANAPFSRKPIGTGPYQLTDLTAEHALLKANPKYYAGNPFINTIELRFFASPQAALAALTRGESMGLGFLSTSELGRLALPRSVVRRAIPIANYTVLTFNLRDGPLADQGVRRALAEGLDKDALIAQALDGQAVRLDTPILPGWWAASPDAAWYPYEQQRAADALTSLGYASQSNGTRVKDGKPLVLPLITDDAPDRVAAALDIVRQWGALGVKVEVEQLDAATLRQRLAEHNFTLALHGWQRLGSDPDVFELWHSSQAQSGENYADLHDDQIDELLTNARQDLDIAARSASYTAFQRRWIDLAPSITLYQPLFVYATSAQLDGLDFGNTGDSTPAVASSHLLLSREDRFRSVVRWFLRSSREIRGDLRQSP
jgi:peptide/nickel transport system substrate-binding protein